MEDVNYSIAICRIVRDAELSYTNSGLAICKFDAVLNKRKKVGDNYEEKPVYLNNLAIFGKRAESLNQYLTKGQQVCLEMSLDIDEWTDTEGKKKSKLKLQVDNIQLLGGRSKPSEQPQQQAQPKIEAFPDYNDISY